MEKERKVTVDIEVEGLNQNIEKATELVELLKKAKTLADELASVDFEINL